VLANVLKRRGDGVILHFKIKGFLLANVFPDDGYKQLGITVSRIQLRLDIELVRFGGVYMLPTFSFFCYRCHALEWL
jgi:hypothetical protein